MTRLVLATLLLFASNAEAKEFTKNQFWSVQSLHGRDPKDDCLEEIHRWAKNDVQFQCRVFFEKQPTQAAQCDLANVAFSDSDYTDRFGSQCQTTATLNVD